MSNGDRPLIGGVEDNVESGGSGYGHDPQLQPRSGRGCLFYGCVTIVVLFFVLIVGGFFAARYTLNRAVQTYTAGAPMALPPIEMSEEEVENIEERAAAFVEQLEQAEPAEPLALDTAELNALVLSSNEIDPENRIFHFDLEEDRLSAWLSLSFDRIERELAEDDPNFEMWDRLSGRYFNGKGWFDVGLRDGALHLELLRLEVNDRPVPEFVREAMAGENLLTDMEMNEEMERNFELLEEVRIEDGRMLFIPKPVEELRELKAQREAAAAASDAATTDSEASPLSETSPAFEEDAASTEGEASLPMSDEAGTVTETEAPAPESVGPTGGETSPASVTEETVQ